MAFEEQFFKRKTLSSQKLLDFGFTKTKSGYCYDKEIMAGDFQAQIEVSNSGQVVGRLIDKDLDDTRPFMSRVRQVPTWVRSEKPMGQSCEK